MDADLRSRLVTAGIGIPLLVGLIGWGPPWLFTGFICVLTVGALFEYFSMAFPKGRTLRIPGIVFGMSLMLAVILYGESGPLRILGTALALGFSLSLLFREKMAQGLSPVSRSLLGGFYIGYLVPFIVLLFRQPAGRAWVSWLVLVIMAGDSAAYFVGRRFGAKKLAPTISPGKTVQGAWSYLAAAVLIGCLGAALLLREMAWSEVLLLSFTLGILGQVGDLFESWIKRIFAVKDSGSVLPGHGGVLDRLDSLIFPPVLISAYLRLFH